MASITYKAALSGSSTGAKTGQLYRFDAGDEIIAPKGEFDHDIVLTEMKVKKEGKDTSKPTKRNTVDEMKAYLDSKNIEYASDAKKDELLEIAGG